MEMDGGAVPSLVTRGAALPSIRNNHTKGQKVTDKQAEYNNLQELAVNMPTVETSVLGGGSFNYASEVAAHREDSSKLRIHDLIDTNLHHFVGFAKAGATLGLACDRIAGVAGCNADSLRRVFLGKLGKWAEFRARIQTNVDPAIVDPAPAESPSGATGKTGFARVW